MKKARLTHSWRALLTALTLILLSTGSAFSQGLDVPGMSGGDFLHPDEAFVMAVHSPDESTLQVEWTVAEEYYLYQHRFDFTTPTEGLSLGEPIYPEAELIEDEFFGESLVHRGRAVIEIPVEGGEPGQEVMLNVRFQGCADAGLCYPPMDRDSPVVLASGGAGQDAEQPSVEAPTGASDQDRLAGLVADGHPALIALIFFGFGLLLSFTPCVLPMVPILSSLILGQGERVSTRRAFGLSLTYVLAMALTYTTAGVAAGLLGHNLQAALQHPAVLVTFALVFGLLALSMFGFYQLQVPQSLQNALSRLSSRQQAGNYTGVGAMGFLSALIVGPCVAAPLAGALLVIGQTGDAVRGGLALFSMSMGMGILLLVVGTSAGRLMPRTGPWMNAVKIVFGFLLLAVGVWMLERILPAAAGLLLWSALLVMAGVYLGALDNLNAAAGGWRRFRKGAGLLILAWGMVLLLAAALGGKDPLRPMQGSLLTELGSGSGTTAPAFAMIGSQPELSSNLDEERNRPLMLEFYADWCVDCVRMERRTFTDPDVRDRLERFDLLKADVTDYTQDHRELLEAHELFGPPAILFFDHRGEEIRSLRLVGFMAPGEFDRHLARVQEDFQARMNSQ